MGIEKSYRNIYIEATTRTRALGLRIRHISGFNLGSLSDSNRKEILQAADIIWMVKKLEPIAR